MNPTPPLPGDFATRIYAGVLGKIIGVYLGRPFEQWSHERIMSELGEIRARVEIRLADSFGLAIRAQGLRRHYSLRIDPGGRARLVRCADGETTLAEAPCQWVVQRPREFAISARGDVIRASMDGIPLLEARDALLEGGAAGFLIDSGGVVIQSAEVEALP